MSCVHTGNITKLSVFRSDTMHTEYGRFLRVLLVDAILPQCSANKNKKKVLNRSFSQKTF